MIEQAIAFLREGESAVAYCLVAFSSTIEYVAPPLPGDTIALFAIFLAVSASYHPLYVYLAMTAGAVVGGVVAWSFGRWLTDHEDSWPSFMKTKGCTEAIEALRMKFDQFGPLYLAINRFIPALRAFFFVGAGMSRMPLSSVVFFGALSAAIWNALLLGIGYAFGSQWPLLLSFFQRYLMAVLLLTCVGLLIVVFRWRSRRPNG